MFDPRLLTRRLTGTGKTPIRAESVRVETRGEVEAARQWHLARVAAQVDRLDSPATRDLRAALAA